MTGDRSSVPQGGGAKRGMAHSGGGRLNKSTTHAKHNEALNGEGELRTVHRTPNTWEIADTLGSFYLFHNHCVSLVGHIVLCSTR